MLLMQPKPTEQQKGSKEIPIPGVSRVPTYDVDYLPTFRERNTYIRGKGGSGYDDATFVEYDADSEDEEWLNNFNRDQARLSLEKFEAMLWKLDIANSEASDKSFTYLGLSAAERRTSEACATTEHLKRQDALQMLEEMCPARDTTRAAVYEFWLQKRAKLCRPLLRRLQAPTAVNNSDPYKVFRPRDRVHRPQTRRRRENNTDSLDKLTLIKQNIEDGLSLLELVVKRERKKRDMVYVFTDWQQLQLKQRFEPRNSQEDIEQEYLTAAKTKGLKRPLGFEDLPEAAPVATNSLLDFRKRYKKQFKKQIGIDPHLNAVNLVPSPPLPPQPCMLAASGAESLEKSIESEVAAFIPTGGMGLMSRRTFRSRIGRGGRVIFDRCRPFSWEPLDNEEDEGVVPLSTLSNPYITWASGDLVAGVNGTSGNIPKLKLKTNRTQPSPNPQLEEAQDDENQKSEEKNTSRRARQKV